MIKKMIKKRQLIISLFDVVSYLNNNPEVIKNSHIIQRKLPSETLDEIDNFYKEKRDEIVNIKNRIYSE